MKKTARCPKCEGENILRITEILDKMGGRVAPFSLRSDQHTFSRDDHGVLEAFVCEECGYVEWYARTPVEIPVDGTLVQRWRGAPARYR